MCVTDQVYIHPNVIVIITTAILHILQSVPFQRGRVVRKERLRGGRGRAMLSLVLSDELDHIEIYILGTYSSPLCALPHLACSSRRSSGAYGTAEA